jgi:hypothetical protein
VAGTKKDKQIERTRQLIQKAKEGAERAQVNSEDLARITEQIKAIKIPNKTLQ